MMNKILMSVVGIGLGHATRSEAIYNNLKGHARLNVLSYGDAYKYFKRIKAPSRDFGGYEYKGENFSFNIMMQILELLKNPKKLKKDYVLFKKHAKKFNPDYIFTDSEPNAFLYALNHGIRNATLSNLVTTQTHSNIIPKRLNTKEIKLQSVLLGRLMNYMLSRGDRFFVPSFESKVLFKEKVTYTDLIVRQKPSEIESVKKLREKIGIDRDFYFVHVGGSGIERFLFHIYEHALSKLKDKYFVISSNYATKKIIKKDNMIIYPFIKNTLDYLKLSEGMISPAGHSSISEAIIFKKPMMVVPLRNHIEQIVNAALLEKEEYGKACFFDKKMDLLHFRQNLDSFFKQQDSFKTNLKKTKFNGSGAKDIAEIILKNISA